MISITSRPFGKTKDGKNVTAFDMKNDNHMQVTVLDYGCAIQKIIVQDKHRNPVDIILGYDDLASYEEGSCFYGAVVGRFANRIGGASFILDGKRYELEKNIGENNHVHGVFAKRLFQASIDDETLVLKYLSPSMEEGFPGNLNIEVRYHLTNDNALEISYTATTDQPTILNLTNHCYFNLNGQDGSTVFDHHLKLNCSYFTEYNDDFSQNGKITPVANTPLDFRKGETIGARFNNNYYQFRICTGYDHNMVIDGTPNQLKIVGTCKNEKTGITLTMYTTEPAIQLYSANFIQYDSAKLGKNGIRYPKNGGFCMEAQHYPDSPRYSHFPSTILRPGEVYTQKTIYKIS